MVTLVRRFLRSRFSGFALVGGVVFILGLGLLTGLVEAVKLNMYVASVITTIFSVEINFTLNKYLNWRDRTGSLGAQWLKFHISRAGTITLNQILFFILVLFGVHYLVVTVVTNVVVTPIINFFFNELFVFKKKLTVDSSQEGVR